MTSRLNQGHRGGDEDAYVGVDAGAAVEPSRRRRSCLVGGEAAEGWDRDWDRGREHGWGRDAEDRPSPCGSAPPFRFTAMAVWHAPAARRQRPRMWFAGLTDASPCLPAASALVGTAAKRSRCASGSGSGRSSYYDSDSDDEDECSSSSSSSSSSDDSDSDSDSDHEDGRGRHRVPPRKRRRAGHRRRASHGGRGVASHEKPNASSATVRFSRPLVTAVRTRPRTDERDRAALFYAAADHARFREEARRERRLRSCGEWVSEDEESDSNSDSDEETDSNYDNADADADAENNGCRRVLLFPDSSPLHSQHQEPSTQVECLSASDTFPKTQAEDAGDGSAHHSHEVSESSSGGSSSDEDEEEERDYDEVN